MHRYFNLAEYGLWSWGVRGKPVSQAVVALIMLEIIKPSFINRSTPGRQQTHTSAKHIARDKSAIN